MSLSKEGLEFIYGYEKYKEFPYDDSDSPIESERYCTIGYGHLIAGKKSCATLASEGNKKYLKFKEGVKKPEAAEICKADVERITATLSEIVQVPLHQHEYDALVSLSFNAGSISKFEKLVGKLNTRDYSGCCKEFADITNKGVKGLVKRRKAEMNMFTNCVYDSIH